MSSLVDDGLLLVLGLLDGGAGTVEVLVQLVGRHLATVRPLVDRVLLATSCRHTLASHSG